MNQMKIGSFLRTLRKENGLTQEQIAEKMGVSARSVSRWENGNTMPDISILIELSDYYDVDLREILNGERKDDNMNAELKETLEMVANYTNEEKEKLLSEIIDKVKWITTSLGLICILNILQIDGIWQGEQLTISLAAFSFVFSIITKIQLRQYIGKANKNAVKKFIKGAVISGVILAILVILLILSCVGII